jgi:hypothetical protein
MESQASYRRRGKFESAVYQGRPFTFNNFHLKSVYQSHSRWGTIRERSRVIRQDVSTILKVNQLMECALHPTHVIAAINFRSTHALPVFASRGKVDLMQESGRIQGILCLSETGRATNGKYRDEQLNF